MMVRTKRSRWLPTGADDALGTGSWWEGGFSRAVEVGLFRRQRVKSEKAAHCLDIAFFIILLAAPSTRYEISLLNIAVKGHHVKMCDNSRVYTIF